jgi:hypothetical protein
MISRRFMNRGCWAMCWSCQGGRLRRQRIDMRRAMRRGYHCSWWSIIMQGRGRTRVEASEEIQSNRLHRMIETLSNVHPILGQRRRTLIITERNPPNRPIRSDILNHDPLVLQKSRTLGTIHTARWCRSFQERRVPCQRCDAAEDVRCMNPAAQ